MNVKPEVPVVDTILGSEHAQELVHQIVIEYAKRSYSNAVDVATISGQLFDSLISELSNRVSLMRDACVKLLQERRLESLDAEKSVFMLKTSVCATLFPSGEVAQNSTLEEFEYLESFKKLVQNPDIFSWDIDGPWADHFGFADYIEKFVPREVKQ